MKKIILFVFLFVFSNICVQSQTSDYNVLLSYIQTNTKLSTENKIIAVNYWSAGNKISRDANVDLKSACDVFKNANLKGGSKGMIAIVICLDNDDVTSDITLKKDGVTHVLTINASELTQTSLLAKKTEGNNVIFDSNGNIIHENFSDVTFFESIRNLITR